ncbi:unnamed protein product, partial [Rotaria sp. Silwood2]
MTSNTNILLISQTFILASRSIHSIVNICRRAVDNQLIAVLFEIKISDKASVAHLNSDMIVFNLGTLFRLVSIDLTPDNVWYAQLEIADGAMQHIKDQIQTKINARLTWLTFGNYLTVLKQNIAADKYYQYLLHILPPDHPSLVSIYNNMGLMYTLMNNNEKALKCFEKAFEFHTQSSSKAVEQTDSLMSVLRSSHDSTNRQLATLNKLAEMSYRL